MAATVPLRRNRPGTKAQVKGQHHGVPCVIFHSRSGPGTGPLGSRSLRRSQGGAETATPFHPAPHGSPPPSRGSRLL
ncbi:hypothetical protein chiPu_0028628 [Chiloscyllium punctatum]|uniref:Uncharacterized protein n=1 Tax=Chiloscyllium punctatum TaxID=137246 RepID=A0A401TPM9_CHIPU|nr:hypothetical protein [Chiloscyllium punctatum]